jgi:hypothetical protein
VHTLTWTFIQRIFDNADDLHIQLGVRSTAEAGVPSDRFIYAAEKMFRELAIHDDHVRPFSFVAAVEVTSDKERNSHGFEVPWRDRVHESLHVLAIFSLVPFNRHAGIPLSSME